MIILEWKIQEHLTQIQELKKEICPLNTTLQELTIFHYKKSRISLLL